MSQQSKRMHSLQDRCDRSCLAVLSNTQVMAYILKEIVPEFKELSSEEIARGICGPNPHKVDADEFFIGDDLKFDLHFFFRDRSGRVPDLEFDVEAHDESQIGSSVFHRSRFHLAEMRSRQPVRDDDFSSMRGCYSIWLLFRPSAEMRGQVFFTEEACRFSGIPELDSDVIKKLLHLKASSGCYIGVGEPNEKECVAYIELLKFVSILFADGDLSADERVARLERDLGFHVDEELRKEIEEMWSLYDQGYALGFAKGQEEIQNKWFQGALACLVKQKREGRLQETTWQYLEATCPNQCLLKKLQKAVAEA